MIPNFKKHIQILFTNMSPVYDTICNFLRIAAAQHITAFAVVYQAMVEEPSISKTTLQEHVEKAVAECLPFCKDSDKYKKLTEISAKVSS